MEVFSLEDDNFPLIFQGDFLGSMAFVFVFFFNTPRAGKKNNEPTRGVNLPYVFFTSGDVLGCPGTGS